MATFNVRVYGLWLKDNQLLLAHEQYGQHHFVKFIGGGLEYGEGILDALKREFLEELGWGIKIKGHLYTTDFFQKSLFDDTQVISIYYWIEPVDVQSSYADSINNTQLSWALLNADLLNTLSLPIDKKVVELLLLNPDFVRN